MEERTTLITIQTHFERASYTLGMAFADDPLMKYAIPNDDGRSGKLLRMFSARLMACDFEGGVEFSNGGVGVLGWLPHDKFPLPFGAAFRSRTIMTPFYLGMGPAGKLRAHDTECERNIKDKYDGQNYCYIWVKGVSPLKKTEGYAESLVKEATIRMAASGHTVAVLKTENKDSVPTYEAHGFSVSHEATNSASGLPYFVMARALG